MSATKDIKSEYLAIRISPKIKFALELLSRKQYRSNTKVIEWLISQSINKEFGIEYPQDFPDGTHSTRQLSLIDFVWDENEISRLKKMAEFLPELITDEEKKLIGN
jgi:hypothetical protein